MVRFVIKDSLEDRLYKYLIVKHDKELHVTYELSKDAPKEIKEYYPVWLKEQESLKDLKNIKVE